MSGPELKPCPFCGGTLDPVDFGAQHPGDDCVLSQLYVFDTSFDDWNTRAPVDYAALPEVQAMIAAAEARALDSVTTLHTVIADIRAATVGGKPMLSELAASIAGMREMDRAQAFAAGYDAGVQAERVVCAADCQHRASSHENNGDYHMMREAEHCATAIRKRGEE